jgi:YVTN family beta-propeller protein
VGVYDVPTQRFTAQIPVGSNPSSLALDGGDNVLAVANAGSASVTLIDARSNAVLKTLSVGATPAQVLVTNNGIAYVACQDGHSVAIIDLSRHLLLNTLPLSSRPGRMDQPNSSGQIYVTLPDEDSLAVIDTGAQTVVSVVKE